MQQVAAEMNIAETAFVTCKPNGSFEQSSQFGLRWFTPTTEVKLCGHATLATAHVLFNELGNQNSTLRFETLSGELLVTRTEEQGVLAMTFPPDVPQPMEASDDAQIVVRALAGKWDPQMELAISPFLRYMVIHSPSGTSEEELVQLQPKLTQDVVDAGARLNITAAITTWRANNGADYKCRVFAPWAGINEDPVTGSAQTVLAPFWRQHMDKTVFVSQQCSARGGDLGAELVDDNVVVSGQAVVVIRGSITL
ncbi:hypothetical protein EV175_002628 [Coemansia sp. RSA 1933]|nr:hypothetical protein EV175_002628 [Coemansia sp. RSA 1933]